MNRKTKILFIVFAFAAVLAIIFFAKSMTGKNKKLEIIKYSNGLSAVLNKDVESQAVSVFVLVRAGAIDEEQPNQSGLSHFLEHMMFKGSAKYPLGLFAAAERFGAQMNASTSKQTTIYYINAPKDNVYEMIEMLSDSMANPLFPQESIDTERNVIIEELFMRRDWTEFKLAEIIEEKLYQNGVMKNNVGGIVESVSKVKREDLFNYHNKHYTADKMIVSIAGNFDSSKVKKLLKKTFGSFKNKTASPSPNLDIESPNGVSLIIRDNIAAGISAAAFLGPKNTDADILSAALAANILYANIYKALKVRRNILNSINIYFEHLLGPGAFYIEYSFNPKYLKQINAEIDKQIYNLTQKNVSEADLNRAKINFKTDAAFGLQRQDSSAYNSAFWLFLNRKEFADPEYYFKQIDGVSAEDIKEFFNKYYSKEKAVSVTMLPRKIK